MQNAAQTPRPAKGGRDAKGAQIDLEEAVPRRDGPAPLATVVLPFLNAEATLAAAIRSMVLQTENRWILKLIDDGSTDGSLAVARGFMSDRVSVESDGHHLGLSRRLNAAIAQVSTPYVCRMDADDISFPQRLELQLKLLERDADVDVVASSMVIFRSEGELLGVARSLSRHEEICAVPWRGFIFPHSGWTGRTAWFKRHTYNPHDDGAEDQALLYSAHGESRFAAIVDVLLAVREDDRTFSKQFHRRLKFWNAVVREGVRRRAWSDVLLVSLAQPVKIAGDALHSAFGVSWARNRLEPASAELWARWRAIEPAFR